MPSFTADAAAALDMLRRRDDGVFDAKQSAVLLSQALTAALRNQHQRCVEKLLAAVLVAAANNDYALEAFFGYWNFQRHGDEDAITYIAHIIGSIRADGVDLVRLDDVVFTAYTIAQRNGIDFGATLRSLADRPKPPTCLRCGDYFDSEEDFVCGVCYDCLPAPR